MLRLVPPPRLTVHLLAPGADGTGLLVADATAPAALPAFMPEIGPDDRLVTAVQRHLREAWALDAAILETHLPPPASDEDGYVGLAVLEPPPRDWRPPATMTWASSDPSLPEPIGPRARTWLAEWATGTGAASAATTMVASRLDRPSPRLDRRAPAPLGARAHRADDAVAAVEPLGHDARPHPGGRRLVQGGLSALSSRARRHRAPRQLAARPRAARHRIRAGRGMAVARGGRGARGHGRRRRCGDPGSGRPPGRGPGAHAQPPVRAFEGRGPIRARPPSGPRGRDSCRRTTRRRASRCRAWRTSTAPARDRGAESLPSPPRHELRRRPAPGVQAASLVRACRLDGRRNPAGDLGPAAHIQLGEDVLDVGAGGPR